MIRSLPLSPPVKWSRTVLRLSPLLVSTTLTVRAGPVNSPKLLERWGLKIVADEKYNRTDTSVTAQALKVLSTKADAVLVAAAGTPGTLPQTTLVERGYKGKIYQTMALSAQDFLRVGGAKVEGTLVAVPPMVVAESPSPTPIRFARLGSTSRPAMRN